jgi:hypothetical protein
MSLLLKNALAISDYSTKTAHSTSFGAYDKAGVNLSALERYMLSPKETENIGGLIWDRKKVRNGSIFTEKGIWLNFLPTCIFAYR